MTRVGDNLIPETKMFNGKKIRMCKERKEAIEAVERSIKR